MVCVCVCGFVDGLIVCVCICVCVCVESVYHGSVRVTLCVEPVLEVEGN